MFLFSEVGLSSSKTNTNTKQIENNPRSFYLPFFEDWSSGSLETNNWQAETENWKINNQEGNERPSVEFDWSPLLEDDYSSSLESDQFNGELYKVGMVFLEYDLKLFDRNATGDEKLSVEVFDGEEWNQVAEYSNNGSFDWLNQSVEISEFALNKNFKIRFNAKGQDSYDIMAWYVDNIEVYRFCDPPFDLDGSIYFTDNDIGCQILWSAPESTVVDESAWVHWDNGSNDRGIGILGTGDFTVASRWDFVKLQDYVGDTIKTIRFYLSDSGYSQIIVKIWTGEEGDNLVFQKQIDVPLADSWNELTIDTLLFINDNTDYWIGYTVIGQLEGYEPVGVDDESASNEDRNMIYSETSGWFSMADVGLDGNLNIQMMLLNNNTASEGCVGFNIYKQDNDSYPEYLFIGFVNFIDLQNDYSYTDFDIGDVWTEVHCYKVNAVWGISGDTCVSSFALNVVPLSDYVCILASVIQEQNQSDVLLCPNPVYGKLILSSKFAISEVVLANLQGQIIEMRKVNSLKSYQFDVTFLKPGLYILKVNTEKGVVTKKFLKTE